MTDLKPFPSSTKFERERSLHAAQVVHKNALNALTAVHAGATLDCGAMFEQWLTQYVCQLEEEIHRLKSVKFTNKGVVEL